MLASVSRSACRPEPPVGSERPKVRTIGGVSLGMKIDEKVRDLGAGRAQPAQLCGLNRCGGVFSQHFDGLPLARGVDARPVAATGGNRAELTAACGPQAPVRGAR